MFTMMALRFPRANGRPAVHRVKMQSWQGHGAAPSRLVPQMRRRAVTTAVAAASSAAF